MPGGAMPSCTKPTSTFELGSVRRLRLSSEPSDDSTLSVMRLRARMALYCCAAFQNVLPSGPALMVSVLGGAGWMRRTASQIAAALMSRMGPNDTARSRHEMATKRATRRGGFRLAGLGEPLGSVGPWGPLGDFIGSADGGWL